MRKLSITCFAAVIVCLGAFFLNDSQTITAKAAKTKTKITLLKSINIMEQGSSYAFKAKVNRGKVKDIIWKSSNKNVLNISSTGKVKAKMIGQATITAKIGKASVTKKVTVYPSLNEISKKNAIAANLDAGVYSSIFIRAEGKDTDYNAVRAIAKDKSGYITISSGSSVQLCKGNLKYSYDKEEDGLVSIYASKHLDSSELLPVYKTFSNEKVITAFDQGDTYRISTETDIAGLTKKEQEERTGITDGMILQELVVNKKTGLLQELIYTILFDKTDPDYKYVSHEVFSYNEDSTKLIPETINKVMNTEKTRTVTIISGANTAKEKKEIYTLPDSMPLYVAADVIYYKDAACTQEADPVVKKEDGTYDNCLVYVK